MTESIDLDDKYERAIRALSFVNVEEPIAKLEALFLEDFLLEEPASELRTLFTENQSSDVHGGVYTAVTGDPGHQLFLTSIHRLYDCVWGYVMSGGGNA